MRQKPNNGNIRRINAQQAFEQAADTSRFTGDEMNTRVAREQAIRNINRDDVFSRPDNDLNDENTDAEERRYSP